MIWAGLGSTPELEFGSTPTPTLELELELKPPELELIFKRLAGVGVGVETPGVGVGVDIQETCRSWSWNSRSWSWYSRDLPELELKLPELELKLSGVGVLIGFEIFFYIYIYIYSSIIWNIQLWKCAHHIMPGVYTKFSGSLSTKPFPCLIQKFPCTLLFKNWTTRSSTQLVRTTN